jgi:hypothetical protein
MTDDYSDIMRDAHCTAESRNSIILRRKTRCSILDVDLAFWRAGPWLSPWGERLPVLLCSVRIHASKVL